MINNFLSRLQKVKKTGKNSWVACCPAHLDNNPSMSVSVGDDGRVLAHCFSQECSFSDIIAAVGLEFNDVMPKLTEAYKPLKMAVNPRDALFCVRSDAYLVLLMAKDVQAGKVLSSDDTLSLAKAIGRIQMAITLSGESL